jgi:hypothetical protein
MLVLYIAVAGFQFLGELDGKTREVYRLRKS